MATDDPKQMHVGIVCQNFPPATFEGGISHYTHHLAKALIAHGHRVCALTSTEFTLRDTELWAIAGLEVIRIQGPWNHRSVLEIKKTVTKKKFDAVLLQYSPASFKAAFRITWALTPFPRQKVMAFHTLWGGGLDRLVGLLMLVGCKKIIATNSEVMTLLERHFPMFLQKTYWIPIGSNIEPLEQNATEANAREDHLFSYFGMLYPGKGLSLILSTLEGMKSRGCRFQFKFVGGGMLDAQDYEAHFQKEILEKGLGNVAEHLGLLSNEEVSSWLSASRFIFLPYEMGLSDRRGSFMAAIAHGKPVLTSPPVVDMPYLKNGINVLWPQHPTPEGYIEAAERLLTDDHLIRGLEEGARKLAQHFRWNRIAEDYLLALRSRPEQQT